MQADLPEAWVIKNLEDAQGEEIEAVIVNSNYSRRKPRPSIEDYLATNEDEFEHSNPAGDIQVYTRKPDT